MTKLTRNLPEIKRSNYLQDFCYLRTGCFKKDYAWKVRINHSTIKILNEEMSLDIVSFETELSNLGLFCRTIKDTRNLLKRFKSFV